MEFVLEAILEIIMTPIVEGYAFAMMRFTDKNQKADINKIKCLVVLECIILILLFIIGGVMIFETNGASLLGKLMFIFSIAVSVLQIIAGIVLRKIK